MEMNMARPATGTPLAVEQAVVAAASATTAEQLRQALAVSLPLQHGLSLAQTAQALGISRSWTCQLRLRFLQGRLVGAVDAPTPGGRRRQNMTPEQESAFLAPFFDAAASGGILVVGEIKRALDVHLARSVSLASVYTLLHRHGWRKLAPDKRHPKSDPAAQEAWKKNSATRSQASAATGRKANPSS
jgi:transposase